MKRDLTEASAGVSQAEAAKSPQGQKRAAAPLFSIGSELLGDVEVTLTATLGECQTSLSALLALEPGSVMQLGTPLDGIIDLSLNGRVVAQGEIVAVGDQFGVRVVRFVAEKS